MNGDMWHCTEKENTHTRAHTHTQRKLTIDHLCIIVVVSPIAACSKPSDGHLLHSQIGKNKTKQERSRNNQSETQIDTVFVFACLCVCVFVCERIHHTDKATCDDGPHLGPRSGSILQCHRRNRGWINARTQLSQPPARHNSNHKHNHKHHQPTKQQNNNNTQKKW